uniref:Uncharacterized protein n=1 Tax=Arundo donax TaxID=35708 RepID=A0A0A9GYC4_ARUDO
MILTGVEVSNHILLLTA